MTNASLHEALERAARLMEMSWKRDILPLRTSRMLHDRVKPFLAKLGNDGYVVGQWWYQDYVLSGIRRIVDTGKEVVSIRSALLQVRSVADEITPAVLLDFHGRRPEWSEETNLRFSAEWVRQTVTGARPDDSEADTSVIGKRTVQADLDRIKGVADRAYRLATLVTAHRLDLEEEVSVTDGEIEQLLVDISSIYERWSLPLGAVDVDTSIAHFQAGSRMAEALRLYDHAAVGEVMVEYLRSLDFKEPRPSRAELVTRMRAKYQIDGVARDGGTDVPG